MFKQKSKQLSTLKAQLKVKEADIERKKNSRDNQKKVVNELIEKDPSLRAKLKRDQTLAANESNMIIHFYYKLLEGWVAAQAREQIA